MKYPYTMDDVRASASRKLFTVVSTFSGGGGSSLGYKLAGGDVRLALEFVPEAAITYRANFPETPVLVQDIRETSGSQILKTIGINSGDLDILDGSPPCSAFSMSGKREKGWDQEKNYSTGKRVKNIEDLFFDFIRLADELKPKVVIGENVQGLTTGEAAKKLNSFINAFDRIGYETVFRVINAKHHGAPQSRARVIIICVRRDIFDGHPMFLSDLVFPPEQPDRVPVRTAFSGLVNDQSDLDWAINRHAPGTSTRNVYEAFPQYNNTGKILTGADTNIIPPQLNKNGKSFFNMKKLAWDLPSPTVTALDGSIPSSLIHPGENRKLTVKEYTRLMALPDDYINIGKPHIQVERIGRMHCPFPLAKIAERVYTNILSQHRSLL